MITWIIQKDPSEQRSQINQKIRTSCLSYGNKYLEVEIVPFEHSVVGGDPKVEGKVVLYGSTAMLSLQKRNNWEPGVFRIYNESDTLAAIGSDYLNSDMKVLQVDNVIPYVQSQGWNFFFVKPDKDLKSFDGAVFDIEKFPFFIERIQSYANYDPETKICVSSVKHPEIEWRFVIVDRKVVAFSQYRVERRLDIKGWAERHAIDFAEAIASYASPNDIYVMDVCKIDGKYKVIEYNTFNFSGLYACDIYDIVKSVNRYLGITKC